MSRKIYINSNFEYLLALHFAKSLFLKFSNGYKILRDPLDVYFIQIFSKISEKKCCFVNNIFHKFEIDVCFAPLFTESRKIQFSISTRVTTSPIRLPACNGENLIPLVIIVSMCEVFSPERRCTRHALQKHYTNRQMFKKF